MPDVGERARVQPSCCCMVRRRIATVLLIQGCEGSVVYRVVVKRLDHRDRWLVERGPWITSEKEASAWANTLRRMGYVATVENMSGEVAHITADSKLANPLEAVH